MVELFHTIYKLNCVSLWNFNFHEKFLLNNIHVFKNGSILCRFLQNYDYVSRFLCPCIVPDCISMNRYFFKCQICYYASFLEIEKAILHCHCHNKTLVKLACKPSSEKWWNQRLFLFSKFNQGIIIESNESWYSVIPENIALSVSNFFINNYIHLDPKSVLLDAFCGVGGSAIQFAKNFKVYAIDIDPRKIEAARHNARIYNVHQNIEFIVGDFFQVAPALKNKVDAVFLAPPWGGPNYKKLSQYDLEINMPFNGKKIFSVASAISKNIGFYVPKNTNRDQLMALDHKGVIKIQELWKRRPKGSDITALTVYYGPNLAK